MLIKDAGISVAGTIAAIYCAIYAPPPLRLIVSIACVGIGLVTVIARFRSVRSIEGIGLSVLAYTSGISALVVGGLTVFIPSPDRSLSGVVGWVAIGFLATWGYTTFVNQGALISWLKHRKTHYHKLIPRSLCDWSVILSLPFVIALFNAKIETGAIIAVIWIFALIMAGAIAMNLDAIQINLRGKPKVSWNIKTQGANFSWIGLMLIGVGQSLAQESRSTLPISVNNYLWGWLLTGMGVGLSSWAALMLPFLVSLSTSEAKPDRAIQITGTNNATRDIKKTKCPICNHYIKLDRWARRRWIFTLFATVFFTLFDILGIYLLHSKADGFELTDQITAVSLAIIIRFVLIYKLIWPQIIHALHEKKMGLQLFILLLILLTPSSYLVHVINIVEKL